MSKYGAVGSRLTQAGAVLFVALVMLLLMTLLGLSGMRGTTMEEKMAGNLRDASLALQAAETALRAGERWIDQLPAEPTAVGSCGANCDDTVFILNSQFANQGNDYLANELWSGPAVRTYAEPLASVKTPPKYLVEYHSFLPDSLTLGQQSNDSGRTLLRTTARGTGQTDLAQSVTQSTYARRFK